MKVPYRYGGTDNRYYRGESDSAGGSGFGYIANEIFIKLYIV